MGLKSRDGVDIKEYWKDGIRLYLGTTFANYPNAFMVSDSFTPFSSCIALAIHRLSFQRTFTMPVQVFPLAATRQTLTPRRHTRPMHPQPCPTARPSSKRNATLPSPPSAKSSTRSAPATPSNPSRRCPPPRTSGPRKSRSRTRRHCSP